MPQTISPADFSLLDDYTATHPLQVDLVYAKPHHPDNMFKAAIYRQDAPCPVHKILLPVVLAAASQVWHEHRYILSVKDALRPVEAQQAICDSAIVRAHPEWLVEPRLFSPPGAGAHPRGMAVDVVMIDENGDTIDMGTPFDYLTTDKKINPAARDYSDFGRGEAYNALVKKNRRILEDAMLQSARACNVDLLPLPQEWWDFRLQKNVYEAFAPVSDAALYPAMRMMP